MNDQELYESMNDASKIIQLKILRLQADLVGMDKCVVCKRAFFFVNDTHARIEGHVYSSAGIKEVNITRICEYCFDKMTGGTNDGL